MLAFHRNETKLIEHLRIAHKAVVEAAMICSDISVGKVYEDGLLDAYIEEMHQSKQESLTFGYINKAGKKFRVRVDKL